MAGRPTDLTDELTLQIRKLVLDSVEYVVIQESLGISPNTWDSWVHRNTQGFRDNLVRWKKERIVKKAEAKVEALIEADDERVALNASQFALETLGKDDGYSKRTEMTGKDGEKLFTPSAEEQERINKLLQNGGGTGDSE